MGRPHSESAFASTIHFHFTARSNPGSWRGPVEVFAIREVLATEKRIIIASGVASIWEQGFIEEIDYAREACSKALFVCSVVSMEVRDCVLTTSFFVSQPLRAMPTPKMMS